MRQLFASTRYYFLAVVVSLLWWPLLQIAPIMREFLGTRSVLEIGVVAQLVMFAIAGLTTAVAFRWAIVRSRGIWNAIVGIGLAFVTAEIFSIILVIYHTIMGNRDVWSAVMYGPMFAAHAFYVVMPLGVVTQWVMQKVGTLGPVRHAGQQADEPR